MCLLHFSIFHSWKEIAVAIQEEKLKDLFLVGVIRLVRALPLALWHGRAFHAHSLAQAMAVQQSHSAELAGRACLLAMVLEVLRILGASAYPGGLGDSWVGWGWLGQWESNSKENVCRSFWFQFLLQVIFFQGAMPAMFIASRIVFLCVS